MISNAEFGMRNERQRTGTEKTLDRIKI